MPKCTKCGEDVSFFEADLFGGTVCPACISIERQKSIESSGVATALTIIAVMELIASPIAGIAIGSENTSVGWLVFVSGVISGLILLGFARVIAHSYESAQRLYRIEVLLQRVGGDRNTQRGVPVPVPTTREQPIPPSQAVPDSLPILRPYFFSVDGKDSGPYSLDEMRQFRKSGKLTDETLVIRQGDGEWQPVSMFTEICF